MGDTIRHSACVYGLPCMACKLTAEGRRAGTNMHGHAGRMCRH